MNVVYDREPYRMRELALFAGAGGGILGGRMLGWRTVCAVEIADYPRRVLLQRQQDGVLGRFPIWDDVTTFDGTAWRGKVDVISGGFPCQDISSAGKGLGIENGKRSGLWKEYARIIREVRPRYVFVENSPMLVSRGLGIVLGDLAEAGYDAAWRVLSAEACGAPHRRERMWIVGKISDADGVGQQQSQGDLAEGGRWAGDVCPEVADAVRERLARTGEEWNGAGSSGLCCREGVYENVSLSDTPGTGFQIAAQDARRVESAEEPQRYGLDDGWGRWWAAEPELGRVAHGVANRVDRIKAIGNGQVPIVAARAFLELYDVLNERRGER